MFMSYVHHPVDLPDVPPLTHLSLRVNGLNCQNFVADVVRRSISTLTHLELYSCNRVEIRSILFSRPVKLRHLICLDHPPRPHAEEDDYLDIILPSLVELRSLVLGPYGYTSFSFVDELPRLRELVIVVEHVSGNNQGPINLLFLDLKSRLTKNRLTSINISIQTCSARWFPQDQLSPLHLLSKACNEFGIKFKVHVFHVNGAMENHEFYQFQVAAAKRR
jgi:hypothetical protein